MFVDPAMKDHLSWETTKFSGRFMQVPMSYDIEDQDIFRVDALKSEDAYTVISLI